MALIEQLLQEDFHEFHELVGNAILSILTTISTLYIDNNNEFSGTGLLISDGSLKYVLTADHVLNQ
jgi:hypothetical protein